MDNKNIPEEARFFYERDTSKKISVSEEKTRLQALSEPVPKEYTFDVKSRGVVVDERKFDGAKLNVAPPDDLQDVSTLEINNQGLYRCIQALGVKNKYKLTGVVFDIWSEGDGFDRKFFAEQVAPEKAKGR